MNSSMDAMETFPGESLRRSDGMFEAATTSSESIITRLVSLSSIWGLVSGTGDLCLEFPNGVGNRLKDT